MMRSRVVSSLIVDRIRAKPELKPVEIIQPWFYPLAFGVVDSETEENWTWFLQHLASLLLPMGTVVTFFSDRNQGLLNAMGFVFPEWPHSYCYYHLKQNLISKYLKSGYGKLLQDRVINLFSRCAYAITEEEFTVAMEEFVIVGSSKVKAFIFDLSRDHYANAYFKGMQYGEMANSLAESFNNWVGVFQDLPVLPLIEGIRHKLMVLNSQRQIEAEKWTTILCPEMETRLWENAKAGRTWVVRRSSFTVFEVFADYSVMVDLKQRTCSCHLWQIDGFHCTHAVAAILAKKDSVYDYVECYYRTDFFLKAYESHIFPILDIGKGLGSNSLAAGVVLLPITNRPAERPPTKRIKAFGEFKKPLKCSRCSVTRQNRKTCKAVI
ncbi:PREDICTED: uncharacterized protein LOC103334566 [Prunus mume]|uniref:Uncharacterized protein LOC103334566 n=1 Tax=Prunus mume TaxID=102107 RepID=A0ABM0P8A1_PRUMU|nr:PREDICTED: uncharacterized protein LOC103334566 [Prunus mume]